MSRVGPRAQKFNNFLAILTGKDLRKELRREGREFLRQLKNPQSYQAPATINGAPISILEIEHVPPHVLLAETPDGLDEPWFMPSPGTTGPTSLGGPVEDPLTPPPSRERNEVKDVLKRLQKIAPSAGRAAKKVAKLLISVGLAGSGSFLILASIPFLPYAAAGWAAIGGACLLLTLVSVITAARNYKLNDRTITDFKDMFNDRAKLEILADELTDNKDLEKIVFSFLIPTGGAANDIKHLIEKIGAARYLIRKYDQGNRNMTVEDVDNLLRNFSRDNLANLSFGQRILDIKRNLAPQPAPPSPSPTPPGAGAPATPSGPVTTPGRPGIPTPPGAPARVESEALAIINNQYLSTGRSLRRLYDDVKRLTEILRNHEDDLTGDTTVKVRNRLEDLKLERAKIEKDLGLRLETSVKDPTTNRDKKVTYLIELADEETANIEISWGIRIGTGGMADVYKAINTATGTPVAIKVVRASEQAVTEVEPRERRGAAIGISLRHKNLVEVYAMGRTKMDSLFIAMEYIEGQTAAEYIEECRQRGVRIDFMQAVDWLMQAIDGIDHAHRHDVVHRDIKGSNIFLAQGKARQSAEGTSNIVAVGDFGLGKSLDNKIQMGSSIEPDVTRDNAAIIGTLSHLPPEAALLAKLIAGGQIKGQDMIRWSKLGDIYALGIFGYDLFTTGERPFEIKDFAHKYWVTYKEGRYFVEDPNAQLEFSEAVQLIRENKQRTAGDINLMLRDIPPEFHAFFKKALTYDLHERFRNTREMKEALRTAADAYQASLRGQRKSFSHEAYAGTVLDGPEAKRRAEAARDPFTGTREETIAELEAIFYSQIDENTGRPIIEIRPGEEMDWVARVSSIKVDINDKGLKALISDTIRLLLEKQA